MPSLASHAQSIADAYQPPATGNHSLMGDASTVHEFLQAIGEGNYVETAAKLAGIAKQSVYNWIKRGQAGEEPFNAFVDALEKAEARAEAHMLANVRKASELPQFWAAGMTVLERRHPDRWGKRQDDSAAPRVVVQVGGNASDVKVAIAFAVPSDVSVASSQSEAKVEADGNSLIPHAFAEFSSPITAVMVPNHEAGQVIEAGTEALNIPAVAHGSPGPAVGAGITRARNFFAGKGRSKKKGVRRKAQDGSTTR